MVVQRVFLDWTGPCLPAAAAWLIDHAETPKRRDAGNRAGTTGFDLQRMLCVLPGARAGRLFLAHLVNECERKDLALIPPRVLTPGPMVDVLLHVTGPRASHWEMTLAWMKVLRSAESSVLATVLPRPPANDDDPAWHGLARMFTSLHDELAGGRVSFADVARRADDMAMVAEAERWRTLEELHALYRRTLEAANLLDPHAAREAALNSQPSGPADADHVVLLGVVDLNAMQRVALAQCAGRVTALVHAPESLADHFDDFGCVRNDAWDRYRIDIPDEQIKLADRPEDQAQAAMHAMADLNGAFAPQQITIGLGDEALAPYLERAAEWAGVHVHSAPGRALDRTAPARLLEAAADWLAVRRFAHLATLLRHPDLEDFGFSSLDCGVESQARSSSEGLLHAGANNPRAKSQKPKADWLSLLDRYFNDHLHARLTSPWLGNAQTRQNLKHIHDAVNHLLAPLGAPLPKKQTKSLREWAPAILQVVANVYQASANEDRSFTADPGSVEACAMLSAVLQDMADAPDALQPRVDAATAVRMALTCAASLSIAPQPRRDQIDMLGWLELHLDPAPALIITACNDGAIPQSRTADAFLPDSLRSALGLQDNARRYARDTYLLSAILHSRRNVTLIAGRHTARGEPLAPSRLLLACDDQSLVKRIKVMCRDDELPAKSPPVGMALPEPPSRSRFTVPPLPQPLPTLDHMRVTAFRDYLACPYRFALKWLVKLDGMSDDVTEMDPLGFGILAHEVLSDFGADGDAADLADPQAIEKFLLHRLDARSRPRFGDDPLPAVLLQKARLQLRLRSFAQFQAKHRADGWLIRHCEWEFNEHSALDIPGDAPMPIAGRIDRIDQNERTGAWRIIDYKTGENGESPCETHHGCKKTPDGADLQWLDLQLPLYWFLARQRDIAGDIQLGYIVLPKRSDGVEFRLGEWRDHHLEHAIETAREVVRNIRAGRFDFNADDPDALPEFARICHTTTFATEEAELETVA